MSCNWSRITEEMILSTCKNKCKIKIKVFSREISFSQRILKIKRLIIYIFAFFFKFEWSLHWFSAKYHNEWIVITNFKSGIKIKIISCRTFCIKSIFYLTQRYWLKIIIIQKTLKYFFVFLSFYEIISPSSLLRL